MAATTMMMGLALAVSAVGAIGSGIAAYSQGQQQNRMAQQQARYAQNMAMRNQQIAENAALSAEAKGRFEAGLVRERAQKLLGKQKALAGASGVTMAGSLLEPITQSWAEGERDANTAHYNAAYEAWKLRTGGETSLIEGSFTADRYKQQGEQAEQAGKTSLIMSGLSAGSSILTGFSKYQYYGAGGAGAGKGGF